MAVSAKRTAGGKHSRRSRDMGILDLYSPLQVGKILRTSTKKKPDIFDIFRPKSEENLKYEISETNVKLDYGPTKINFKTTRATYEPLSPEAILAKLSLRKIVIYSHGGEPLEHYVDDLWLERQDFLQEKCKRELKQFIIRRKKRDRLEGMAWHNTIQALLGPEWYQELSPNQLRTVDQFKQCILQDVKNGTIINTQENIGRLGLVLRPNPHNIKKALKLCCNCPVEFLLILYQLIDPNRSKYTLNDRLLLSAVVHLTMRDTLREMHIRTPSPPAPEKPKVTCAKKQKPVKYSSPYLEPYTFEPTPRKYTGVYVNKHVQYPESPYFDYRDVPHDDNDQGIIGISVKSGTDIFEINLENLEPDEVEIIEELRLAQAAYDNIQKDAPVKKKLFIPKKKLPLSEFTQYFNRFKKDDVKEKEPESVLPGLATLSSDEDEECECDKIMEDMGNICCDDAFMTPCGECEGECTCRQKTKIFTKCKKCLAKQRKQNAKRIIGGVTITRSDNIIPIMEGTSLAKDDCDCLQRYKEKLTAVAAANNLRCQQTQYAIGGVVLTKTGPVYHISTAFVARETTDGNLEEAEDEICCETEEKNASGPKPCTCGICKPAENGTGDNLKPCCGVQQQAIADNCQTNKREGICPKPCPCGMSRQTEDDNCKRTSNRQVVPCHNCRCGSEPDKSQCPCGCGGQQNQTKKSSKHKDDGCCENDFSEPCDCEGVCDCKEQSKLYTSPKCPRCLARQKLKYVQKIIGGLKKSRKDKYVPIVEGTRQLEECQCLCKYKEKLMGVAARNKIKCRKAKFIVGGVVLTKKGPVYILSTAFINKPQRRSDSDDEIYKPRKKVEEDECLCDDCKQEDESSEEEEIIKYSACRCREELDKFLAEKCACEDCNIENRQRNATHIIAGAKYTQSGTAIKILEGIQEQRCDCLTQYMENIRNLDDYRKRCEAKHQLMSQEKKYSIGGVTWTPEGPVYVISGMRPPVECDCAAEMRRKAEEELHLSRMARMPLTGRIKYQISGVAQTPEGNVYIVSQALPIDDCDCVRLYHTFRDAHSACLESYEQYLAQVQEEIVEYQAEASETYRKFEKEITDTTDDEKDTDFHMSLNYDVTNEKSEVEKTVVDVQEKTVPVPVAAVTCTCLEKHDSNTSSSTSSSSASSGSSSSSEKFTGTCTCVTPPGSNAEEEDSEEDGEYDGVQGKKDNSGKASKKDKKGAKKQKRFNKKKGKKGDKGKVKKKFVKTIPDFHSKRFYITEKMPCNTKQQMEILKKILAGMAEDGFSLAKLPDSYKLPHFKLWMQLRCGKFWTQQDRYHYELFSKSAYFHTDHCYREPPSPKNIMDRNIANQMTWKDADYVRKIASEKIGLFYRTSRQENVETGREFFPLTFSYEFPSRHFRDCYFAYMPSKEEDVIVYRIIKPYEARVNIKKYRCYC